MVFVTNTSKLIWDKIINTSKNIDFKLYSKYIQLGENIWIFKSPSISHSGTDNNIVKAREVAKINILFPKLLSY